MSNDNKEYANKLKDALRRKGYNVKLGEVYDALAEAVGVKNHHAVKANKVDVLSPEFGANAELQGQRVTLPIPENFRSMDKFEFEITRPINTILVVSTYANNPYEAFDKVQAFYDNNGDSCRDDYSNWTADAVVSKGAITSIECSTMEHPKSEVEGLGMLGLGKPIETNSQGITEEDLTRLDIQMDLANPIKDRV